MKNNFKILFLLFFLAIVTQVKSQIVFSEGFEGGALPTGWSYVYVSGSINWAFTNGGNSSHPAAAHTGTKNALFYYGSYSGQTTKLVTTAIDLSSVNLPVLKFWHTQDAFGPDQDQLRVYYKTSAGGSWVLLATYTTEIINWTQETISLPNPSATYYIALEAKTGYGYGVCIDNITIEQTPSVFKSLSSLSINQASSDYLLSGSSNNPILRIDMDVAGNSGSLFLNSLETVSLNTNDIYVPAGGVKLFATTQPAFSPTTQIGSAQNLSGGKAVFNSINYDIPAGISYIWITFDIASVTPAANYFDAYIQANKIDIAGSLYPATDQSPAGNRIIIETIFQDDFETDKGWVLTGEFERNNPQGLGGSYKNPDPAFSYSGLNVLGTDLTGLGLYPGDYEPNLSNKIYKAISPVTNCTFYTNTRLRFYRWLNIETFDKAYIEVSNDNGLSWINVWTNSGQVEDNSWVFQEINISAYADKKTAVIIRFSLGTTDGTNQCSGWNLDDVVLIGDFINPETGVTQILLPVSGCNHTSADTVKIKVKNFGGASTNDTLRVCYSLNGGVTVYYDTIFQSIPIGDNLIFSFKKTADLSLPATYIFFAATLAQGDKNTANDTLWKNITSSPQINIPYFEDFESGQGGWFPGGANSSWQYGTPGSPVINTAASGTKAWKTNLVGYYNLDEQSFLQSPCFNFSGISNPAIEFKLWWISQPDFDGAALEYSVDNGDTWHLIGAFNDTYNWYNYDTIVSLNSGFNVIPGWSYISNGWKKVKHILPPIIANNPDVRFRLIFASGGLGADEGFALDDIAIYNDIPDLGISNIVSPSSSCHLTDHETITATIRNFGSSIFNIGDTIRAGLMLNSSLIEIDTLVLTAPFYPGATINHTFGQIINMQAAGNSE
ncbi:MAG: choice-of-anchor J domain-containing protein [Bacteroidia bacterium]|nr:choice-of-anchor J domain-containing protein [Bacteroidia bacterium]